MNDNTAIKSNTQNAGHLLSIFCWVLIFIIFTIFASILAVDVMSDEIEKPGSDFWPIMMGFVGYVVLILLATRGLRLHQQWARYLAAVLAVVALIAFPVGTVLGLFVLSYLKKGWHEQ